MPSKGQNKMGVPNQFELWVKNCVAKFDKKMKSMKTGAVWHIPKDDINYDLWFVADRRYSKTLNKVIVTARGRLIKVTKRKCELCVEVVDKNKYAEFIFKEIDKNGYVKVKECNSEVALKLIGSGHIVMSTGSKIIRGENRWKNWQ